MSKKSTQETESKPPEWALPGLETVGKDSLALYNAKKGYNVYGGPTQAALSDQTLGSMNGIMAATGGGGPGAAPITNESINKNIPTELVEGLIAKLTQSSPTPTPAPVASSHQSGPIRSVDYSAGSEHGRGLNMQRDRQMKKNAKARAKTGPLW